MKNRISFSAIGILLLLGVYYLSLKGFSFEKKSMEVKCSEIGKRQVIEVYVPKSNFVKRKAIEVEIDSKQFLLKNNDEEIIITSFRKIENCKKTLTINFDRRSKSLSGHENIFFNSIELNSE